MKLDLQRGILSLPKVVRKSFTIAVIAEYLLAAIILSGDGPHCAVRELAFA
jgi:hypothetical protein